VGKKPDIDNLEKFLFDSLEGVIFDDDKHIVQINEASKFYDSSGECKGSTIVKIVSVYDFQNRKANGMDKKAGVTSSAVVDILDK
jgi:Holliday junction resolvase